MSDCRQREFEGLESSLRSELKRISRMDSRRSRDTAPEEPTPEEFAFGERLVRDGWVQMSRKYRHVSLFPAKGKGKEMLSGLLAEIDEASMPYKRAHDLSCMTDEDAGYSYAHRVWSYRPEHAKELTKEEFVAFRRAGGMTADAMVVRRRRAREACAKGVEIDVTGAVLKCLFAEGYEMAEIRPPGSVIVLKYGNTTIQVNVRQIKPGQDEAAEEVTGE